MNYDDEWVRADQMGEVFLWSGKGQDNGHAQLLNGLEAGRVRAFAMVAIFTKVGRFGVEDDTEQPDWLVERFVWQAKNAKRSLRLGASEYYAWDVGKFSKVRLTGLSFNKGDLTSWLDLVWPNAVIEVEPTAMRLESLPVPKLDGSPSRAGRKAGQVNYLGDAGIVERVIAMCDAEGLPLPRVIARFLTEIEPQHLADESKKKRIRHKVLKIRPELRDN